MSEFDQQSESGQQSTAIRVLRLRIADRGLCEELFGSGVDVRSCEVVLRHMMPAPSAASLQAVLSHGLAVRYEEATPSQPSGLLVPWPQISYLRFCEP